MFFFILNRFLYDVEVFTVPVVGCAELTHSEAVVIRRHGDDATISCRYGRTGPSSSLQQRKWNATCRDGQWLGPTGSILTTADIDNCTLTPLLTSGNYIRQQMYNGFIIVSSILTYRSQRERQNKSAGSLLAAVRPLRTFRCSLVINVTWRAAKSI